MAHIILFPIFLALVSTIFPCQCSGQLPKPKFTAILIFGDSLLDTGNNNFINTIFKANHSPYGISFPGGIPTGRFSDGKLISDLMAAALGIKDAVPPFLDPSLSDDDIHTGVCFASAGSGLDDLTTLFSGVIPVSAQPEYLKSYITRLQGIVGEQEADNIIKGALVLLTAGSNDVAFTYYDTAARSGFSSVDQYHDFLQQRIQQFIQTLYSMGLRNIIIAGLPPLGCGPSQLTFKDRLIPVGRECLENEDSGSQGYNKKLIALLHRIEASLPGSKIAYADIYTPLIAMATAPQNYGFTTINRGCCGTGYTEAGPVCNAFIPRCLDPSKFLFFDAIHPSQAAYKVITQYWLDNTLPHFS
ncbi:hypothetical protein LguiA_011920 [Lonicera macranthoides]